MNEPRPGAVHADFPDVDDSEEDLYVIEIEKRHYLEGCLKISQRKVESTSTTQKTFRLRS